MALIIDNIVGIEEKKNSGSQSKVSNELTVGRVLTIELNNPTELGKISYEILFGNSTGINTAFPLNNNFKHYPLPDEIVCIITGPSYELNNLSSAQERYYFSPYSLWYNTHHNKFPNLARLSNETQQGEIDDSTADFTEKANIRSLQPFPGDIIIEGRWGQSIRFGSTGAEEVNRWSKGGRKGDPITIISNGHFDEGVNNWSLIVEDLEKDASVVYITSTQEINIKDINENFSIESFIHQQGIEKDAVLSIKTLPLSYETISRAKQDNQNNG